MVFKQIIAPIIVGLIIQLFDYWLNYRGNKK
ncbi:type I toxin-antitoxin system Fst family toxin [Lactobacillus sp. PV034]|nr:type I toxin-antitoxin system Fst family toxin [Lactobacillus sp. PV034]